MIDYKTIYFLILLVYFLDGLIILAFSWRMKDPDIKNFAVAVVLSPILLPLLIILPIAFSILWVMEKLGVLKEKEEKDLK